jgi:hypothetical protein
MYEGFLTNTVTIYFNDWRFVGDWDFSPDYLLLNLNSDGSYSRIEDINNPVTINGTWETRSDTNLNGAPELYWSHSDKWYDYVYITGTPDKIDALTKSNIAGNKKSSSNKKGAQTSSFFYLTIPSK